MSTYDIANVPEGWVETTLGEIGKVITGKTPSKDNPEDWGEIMDFITPTDIKSEQKFIGNVSRKLSEKGIARFQRMIIPNKSVIITCIGSDMGKVMINKNDCLANQQINSLIVGNDFDTDFVYYKLKDSYQILRSRADGGSTMPILNKTQFEGLSFIFPPLPEQQAIAQILSSFDDKIELLREQNKTLEKIAQTVFQEWFGKYLPERPEELPEGWRASSLTEIANFLNGIALQKFPPENETDYLPVIKIRELKAGITDQTDKASKNIGSKYIVDTGDILFSWSGSLEVVIWQFGKGALNQHLFKVSSENYPKWFYYYWILFHLSEFQGIASNKATTMGHIQRHHLDQAQVIIPDRQQLEEMNMIFEPILEKIMLVNSQIQSLSKTRDELLPRLMSGKVRI